MIGRGRWTWVVATVASVVMCTGVPGCGGGDEPVDKENHCKWPSHCEPAARQMLEEIVAWATEDLQQGRIDPVDHQRIEAEVPRCLDPALRGPMGRHVCDILVPEPCEHLRGIHDVAVEAHAPGILVEEALQRWRVCADELEHFPGSR